MKNVKLSTPSAKEVKSYLEKWKKRDGEKYAKQEEALYYLFKMYPTNTELWQVLLKVFCFVLGCGQELL